MNHTQLIDAIKNTPTRQMLRRLGYKLTSKDTRFHPCPICRTGVKAERDRGNVSVHSSGHGFYCYTCSTGGSNLDLLLHHHNLNPRQLNDDAYAVMRDYLGDVEAPLPVPVATQPPPPLFNSAQVRGWYNHMRGGEAEVDGWIQSTRGIAHFDPYQRRQEWRSVGLSSCLPSTRPDLREAAAAGPCAAFPLYSLATGEICNVVIRPIVPFLSPGQSKPWKARTLNSGTGTTRDGGLPLVYGNPLSVANPRLIVIVEGAFDQLTALAMSPPDVLVLGAFCADDIPHLAPWCLQQSAPIVLIPHLDELQTRCPKCRNGWAKISKRNVWENFACECGSVVEMRRVGQDACRALLEACFKASRGRVRVQILNWDEILDRLNVLLPRFQSSGRSDLNDLVRRDMGDPIATIDRLAPIWRSVLEGF